MKDELGERLDALIECLCADDDLGLTTNLEGECLDLFIDLKAERDAVKMKMTCWTLEKNDERVD